MSSTIGFQDLQTSARLRRSSSVSSASAAGNAGDVNAVGGGISEMRVNQGAGCRVYYKQTGKTIILILCDGDKSIQDKDIKRAKEIAAEL